MTNNLYDRYYKTSIWRMKILGLWPYESQLKRRITFAIFFFLNIIVILPQILIIKKLWTEGRMDNLVEIMVSLAFCTGLTFVYTITYFNTQQLKMLYNNLSNDWKNIENKIELEILSEYSKIGRLLDHIYTACGIVGYMLLCIPEFVPFFLNHLTSDNKTYLPMMPFYGEYVFFDQSDYMYTTHVSILLTFAVNLIVCNNITMLYVIVVYHFCGLINIVIYRLENITLNEKEHQIQNNLRVIAILHDKALKYRELLESLISYPFLVIELESVITLAVIIYYAMKLVTGSFRKIQIGVCCFDVILNFFYLNWIGQRVVNDCERIFYSTYFNDWYFMPKKEQLMLKFIMHRSSKLIYIKAGKILNLSLFSFANLLKATGSYLTVLMSL